MIFNITITRIHHYTTKSLQQYTFKLSLKDLIINGLRRTIKINLLNYCWQTTDVMLNLFIRELKKLKLHQIFSPLVEPIPI